MRNIGIWLIRIALLLLLAGLFFGHLASESYRITEPKSGVMGFLSLRPLHVSSAYLGIITAGLGFLTLIIQKKRTLMIASEFLFHVQSYISVRLSEYHLTSHFYFFMYR